LRGIIWETWIGDPKNICSGISKRWGKDGKKMNGILRSTAQEQETRDNGWLAWLHINKLPLIMDSENPFYSGVFLLPTPKIQGNPPNWFSEAVKATGQSQRRHERALFCARWQNLNHPGWTPDYFRPPMPPVQLCSVFGLMIFASPPVYFSPSETQKAEAS